MNFGDLIVNLNNGATLIAEVAKKLNMPNSLRIEHDSCLGERSLSNRSSKIM